MEHRILLPTDFSDNAWSALVYALKLYKDELCTFYLLNSTYQLVPNLPTSLSKNSLKETTDAAKKELLQLKVMAEESNANSNHGFEIIVSQKDLKDAVKTAVEKFEIELVIMGTKGATGAKEFFYGTNTVHVIKALGTCPVLVIPEEFDFTEPKQIAFPTDFNRFYSDDELEPIRQLAELYNSKIKIMHINVEEDLDDYQQYNIISLKSYFKDVEHSFHWMPKYAKKTTEINDFITELNIDILAMVNYKHSIVENILNEPVIKKIGHQPIIPFLVIPD